MPQAEQGKNRKMTLPYHDPYRIVDVQSNCLLLRLVDMPNAEPLLVNMNRAVRCADELLDESWLGPRRKRVDEKRTNSAQLKSATFSHDNSLHSQSYRGRSRNFEILGL